MCVCVCVYMYMYVSCPTCAVQAWSNGARWPGLDVYICIHYENTWMHICSGSRCIHMHTLRKYIDVYLPRYLRRPGVERWCEVAQIYMYTYAYTMKINRCIYAPDLDVYICIH